MKLKLGKQYSIKKGEEDIKKGSFKVFDSGKSLSKLFTASPIISKLRRTAFLVLIDFENSVFDFISFTKSSIFLMLSKIYSRKNGLSFFHKSSFVLLRYIF